MAISATSSSSGYKVNAIAGMNSGLDTEAIVEAMTSNIQAKIDANKQDTQVLQWQQDAYRDIITDLEGFYDEYFRYSSSDKSITNEAFFDESYCTSSSSSVSVTGNTDAMEMVVVEGGSVQLATKSTITTTHEVQTSALEGTLDINNLKELGGTTLTFEYNGVRKSITIDESVADSFFTTATAETGTFLTQKVDYTSREGVDNFVNYLNEQLADAFGEGVIEISSTVDTETKTLQGVLTSTSYEELVGASIEFNVSSDSTFALVSSNNDSALGEDGILGVSAGTSNKVNVATMKLSDIGGLAADENGNYTMTINGEEFSFSGDTTLGAVMTTVNDSDAGVRMNYSSVTNTFSLMSDSTGAASAIDISGNLASAIFGDEGEISNNVGKDFQANMSFDGGITFTTVARSTNAFAIDGAEYNFTGVGDGTNITFQSGTNTDALVDKVKAFVESYNEIMTTINKAINTNKYGESLGSGEEYLPLTDAQKEEMSEDEIEKWEEKAKTGLLSRDSTLQNIAYRLRSAMTSIVDGNGLYQYGIDSESWSDKGVLTIDEEKLRTQIEKDPDAIADLFTGEDGIASKIKDVTVYAVKGTGSSNGVLVDIAGTDSKSSDTTSQIARRIASLKEALTALETKLDTKKEFWWNKFTYLESYISQMNSQSSFLSSMGT